MVFWACFFFCWFFAFLQALVAEIEQNQVKLDECQTHSKQYCTSVKVSEILTETPCPVLQVTVTLSFHFACILQDYELQLMTYRAFVESTHKSPGKRRRMHSSSDAITQEVGPASVLSGIKVYSTYVIRQCSVFSFKVYGLAHALHSLGDPDDTTCQVYQRCTKKTGRRRGRTLRFLHLKCEHNYGGTLLLPK